jgi:general secretion pathway protein G
MTPRLKDSKGFTLVELLITLVVISLIAAIAIPNLLGAIDRGKQKRTMADMRSIGTAVEAYAVDQSQYPTAASTAALALAISPAYMKSMPQDDGWSNEFLVDATGLNYTITSRGKDGAASGCAPGVIITQLTQDICFSHGHFVQYPQGMQR